MKGGIISQSYSHRRVKSGLILSSFLIVFVFISLFIPFLLNIVYSFSEVSFETLKSPTLIGAANYIALFQDKTFYDAIQFSLYLAVVCTAAEVFLGLLFVIMFDSITRRFPYINVFIALPMMIPPALIGLMYSLAFNEFIGIVPGILNQLGIQYSFLSNDNIVSTIILIEVLQWTPFAYLMILTAWQSISNDYYEAAHINGATKREILFHIQIPIILPTLVAAAFIRFIDSFRLFDTIYVLTKGGPGNLTTTLSIYIYKNFFTFENIGQAVAASMVLLMATIALLVLMINVIRNREV